MAKSVTKSIVCQAAADTGVINVPIPMSMLSALKSAKNRLFSLCVHTGKEVLAALMEEERTHLCGLKGRPNLERQAIRG